MTITLQEALKIMESGECFSIVFYTADPKRNTGGERIEVDSAYCKRYNFNKTKKKVIENSPKPANHDKNMTRNIVVESSGETRTVFITLIYRLNGLEVSV